MTTAKSRDLTLRDRLSRLSYSQACRLLGPRGKGLLREGGRRDPQDIRVDRSSSRFRADLVDAVVEITPSDERPGALSFRCSRCSSPCEHVGATFSLILEEKTALGLARPPRERVPAESLSEQELVRRALEEREERARSEKMTLRSSDPRRLWTDYSITAAASGKTYRLALRGTETGVSYCSCPDFRKNTLGTCKHLLHALAKLRRRFSKAAFTRPYRRTRVTLYLRYGEEIELRVAVPEKMSKAASRVVQPLFDRPVRKLRDLVERIRKLERLGEEVTVHPDAEEYVEARLLRERLGRKCAAIRRDPAGHRLRRELLQVELRPYQLDGIAFAVGAGRAVLADDMGLGKTIQAIGVAELLAREAGIQRVLVISPASVKAQWQGEIERFAGREARIVLGSAEQRVEQYADPVFFTLCNYEQVLRDILAIEAQPWDLIVLDEGQRIKNWQARTSEVVKGLRSRFALVLSGTPLENRIDDLYSVVEFIDEHRLGPAFRFFHHHRVVDDRGKVLGFKNLARLRKTLAPVLLRRTRASVLAELPPRTNEIVRIEPTEEQVVLHGTHLRVIQSIINKPYLSEMDLLRLQKALLMARMAADGTFLVDKQEPGYSSKLEELRGLLARLLEEGDRKVLVFTEWTRMLDRIEALVKGCDAGFVRLDGSVSQRRRQGLVKTFQGDPECAFFLTTNAGATGLNLQAANTVINVDLPWNPALLEQRIGRAHRMGQERPVHVLNLVTEGTIEERMLGTLGAKQELFQAVLDPDSRIDEVDLSSGVEELQRRLEVLLGRKPDAPVDESLRRERRTELESQRREQVELAGGRMLDAAFSFLGEMLPEPSSANASTAASRALEGHLRDCLGTDSAGRPTLSVTLPDEAALGRLASSLARLMTSAANPREDAGDSEQRAPRRDPLDPAGPPKKRSRAAAASGRSR